MSKNSLTHATNSTNLADLLERVLDKGVVVAGDIKIKLVEIELLTIQIRLVICSVERAIEMGMDWWRLDPNLSSLAAARLSELQSAPLDAAAVPVEPPLAAAAASPAVPVVSAAPSTPSEAAMARRVRDLEESLRRMEAKLAAIDLDAPTPHR